jgi:parvulin-like peptidyl-prolyl isomerase
MNNKGRITAVLVGIYSVCLLFGVMCGKEEQPGDQAGKNGEKELKMPPPAGFDVPKRCNIGMIGIAFKSKERPKTKRSKETARKTALKVREEIASGKISFIEAAKKYSDDPSGKSGGMLGFRTFPEIRNFPGGGIAFFLKSGEVSMITEGRTGFFFYSKIKYERKYAKVKRIPYGKLKEKTVSQGTARSEAYKLYSSISSGKEQFDGPVGYIGEVIPGSRGKEFDNALKDLKAGETAAPFDTGKAYIVLKRVEPIQFTFSYILFSGDTSSEGSTKVLLGKADECLKKINGSKEKFYSFALLHHRDEKWKAPWYRLSKDLFENNLDPSIYAFLSKAKTGDISEPLVFANGVYVIMKEELIGKR